MTVLNAELDKHTFRMPVLFSATIPLDLFGRVGIFDQFAVVHDPAKQLSTFTWRANSNPWANRIEANWKAALANRS